ncbi:MAG: ABC transporter permease [Actinomycetales bacterium]|nr:ABC transporter permease [Actinomycetales bacterium]
MRGLGRVLAWSYLVVVFLFILLPVVSLVVFSFQATSLPVPPFSGPSLRWFEALFADPRMLSALRTSVIVGIVSALLATVLGFLAAYGLGRYRPAGATALRAIIMTPLGVSYLVIGFGLLVVANELALGRSLLLVTLGHIIINTPLAFAIILSQMREEHANLERAARDLGAGEPRVIGSIVLPVLLPGLLAAFLLSFTLSWDEFIIAFLLAGFQVTLPVEIWSSLRTGLDAKTNAAGTVVFAISLIVLVLAYATNRALRKGRT